MANFWDYFAGMGPDALSIMGMLPGLPSMGAPSSPMTDEAKYWAEVGPKTGVKPPDALPAGWTPDTIGKGALGAMGPIPGIGPMLRNMDANVAGDPSLRLRINRPGVAPASYTVPAAPVMPDTLPLIGVMPGSAPAAPPRDFFDRMKDGLFGESPVGAMGEPKKPGFWDDRQKVERLSGMLTAAGAAFAPSRDPRNQPTMAERLGMAAEGSRKAESGALDLALKRAQVGKVENEADIRAWAKRLLADTSIPMPVRMAAIFKPESIPELMKELDGPTQAKLAQYAAEKAGIVTGATERAKLAPDIVSASAAAAAAKAGAEASATEASKIRVAQASREPDKAPSGFQWNADRTRLVAIPGGPGTHITGDQAGRIALVQKSLQDFKSARAIFERPWTSLDDAAAQMEMGEVGRAQRTMRTAIEAGLRMMTGAAAPESEVKNYLGLFMPKSYDSLPTRKQKLDNLESFMQNAIRLTTQGRGEVPSMSTSPGTPGDRPPPPSGYRPIQ